MLTPQRPQDTQAIQTVHKSLFFISSEKRFTIRSRWIPCRWKPPLRGSQIGEHRANDERQRNSNDSAAHLFFLFSTHNNTNHGELSYRGRRGHCSPLFQLSPVGRCGSYRVVGRMVTGDFESQSLTIGRFRRSLLFTPLDGTVHFHIPYCPVRSTCSILTVLSSRYLTKSR